MDNPEKLAAHVTQDEEKQSKNTTQYVLDTTMHKQTKITEINVREYRRGIKNANREKLATYGTQDEENLSTNTAHYVLDTTLRKQTK
jgi:hypothetical protein